MLLVTIDDVLGGSAGARLASGEILHLGRAAESGTIEAWLPASVTGILSGGGEGLAVAERLAARYEPMEQASLSAKRAQGALLPPDTRLLAPIPAPSMILAAGLAYRSHLA
jgi:acylpyruvate hydrolase